MLLYVSIYIILFLFLFYFKLHNYMYVSIFFLIAMYFSSQIELYVWKLNSIWIASDH